MSDWIPLGLRVCILKLKVLVRSLCLLQVYAPNATSEYQTFVDEVSLTESIILIGDFNAHVETDTDTWKGVIGMGMGISEYRIQKDPNPKLSGIQIKI